MSNMKNKKEEKKKKIISSHHQKKKRPNQPYIDKKYMNELDIQDTSKHYTKNELKKINEENFQIIKDNRLIQKATYDFTELEIKSLNYTLSKLKPNEMITENDWIEYELIDLIKMLNLKYGTASIELVKKSLHNLRIKSKWVHIENEKEKCWVDLAFFLKVKIENINGKNIVRVKFMQEILDYLQNLHEKFTTQYLVYSMRLKGKYAIRMYELCKSYQNNYIKELDIYGYNFYIDKMRLKWCIEESYRNNDIKRIIDRAINEINKKTDIKISIYDTHKIKKKIDYYIIKIEPNSIFNAM